MTYILKFMFDWFSEACGLKSVEECDHVERLKMSVKKGTEIAVAKIARCRSHNIVSHHTLS